MLRITGFLVLIFLLVGCSQNSSELVPGDVPAPTWTPWKAAASSIATGTAVSDPYVDQREALVYTGVIGYGIKDTAVIEAMRSVPRHEFVPEEYLDQAYANHPLPIGYGQTISQPYIVALMTETAEVQPDDVVLEVGTGSGYQAAVLSEIVNQVYTMEIIGALAERANSDFERLGYKNITVEHGDGYYGWEKHAPYDAIIVTAAPDHVPQPLVQQLKNGGNLIIPVGPVGGVQTLWRIKRLSETEVRTENLGQVRFVPLTREEQ